MHGDLRQTVSIRTFILRGKNTNFWLTKLKVHLGASPRLSAAPLGLHQGGGFCLIVIGGLVVVT